jgi:hypothetical protein
MTDNSILDGTELDASIQDMLGAPASPPPGASPVGVAPMTPSKVTRPATGGPKDLPAYQGLRDSASTPPDYVDIDISELPSGITTSTRHTEMGREVIPGPPSLKAHVSRMRKIGEAEANAGLDLSGFADTLRTAVEPGLRDMANLAAERARVTDMLGSTEQVNLKVDGDQALAKAEAHAKIRAAVDRVKGDTLDALRKAEAEAVQQIEQGRAQPTVEDYRMAAELASTLDLFPVAMAVELLTKRLVEQPAKTGTGLGFVAAVIPILQGKYTSEEKWSDCSEMPMLLQMCEAVVRDSNFYKGRMRLARVTQLKMKVEMYAADLRASYGNEDSQAFGAGRDARYFGELGVRPRSVSGVKAYVIEQDGRLKRVRATT